MSNIENNADTNDQLSSSRSSKKLTAVSCGKDVTVVLNPSQLEEVHVEIDRLMAANPSNPRDMVERQLLYDKGLVQQTQPSPPPTPPIRRSQRNASKNIGNSIATNRNDSKLQTV